MSLRRQRKISSVKWVISRSRGDFTEKTKITAFIIKGLSVIKDSPLIGSAAIKDLDDRHFAFSAPSPDYLRKPGVFLLHDGKIEWNRFKQEKMGDFGLNEKRLTAKLEEERETPLLPATGDLQAKPRP